jgi:hypothetical protein
MFQITKWFRTRTPANTCSTRSPERATHLKVEVLEDRTVPTVTFHGGALLSHVQVQGLYLGDQWSSNPTLRGQVSYLDGFLRNIVNSSYMDALSSAGYEVSRGSAVGGSTSPASLAPRSSLDDDTIRHWVNDCVNNGTLAAPNANTLYVCFVEPDVLVRKGNKDSRIDFLGYHGAFDGRNGQPIRYAVIAYPGWATDDDSVSLGTAPQGMTVTASHEIAEAATDPDANYRTKGWYDDTRHEEIGDITNGQVCYVKGYAVQRNASQTDFAMTPSQATADRDVNFVLKSNGDFVEIVRGVSNRLAGGMAFVSEQGIDNQGKATVDVVTRSGQAWEYHDGGVWVGLGSGIKYAVAGQGVSYIQYLDGRVSEFNNGSFRAIGIGATQISAGTDLRGVNCVDIRFSDATAWEVSDATGGHPIGSGVASVSAGRQGVCAYTTTTWEAHSHSELGYWGSDALLARPSHALQVACGTDANGHPVIDVLYTTGAVWEFHDGSIETVVSSGVWSIGKGRVGAVDMLFSAGAAFEHYFTGDWISLGHDNTMAV